MHDTEPVGLFRRLAAMLYDTLLVAGLLFIAMMLVIVPLGMIQGWAHIDTAGLRSNPLYILYLLAVPLLFFVGFWRGKNGQTLGMRTWHIRVVKADGSPLDLRSALLRYLAALLSWLPLGLGFLWVLVDPQRLAWHDRLSGTRLIRCD